MAAIDILRLFRRVQPKDDAKYITHREFVEAQQRLEQAIDSTVKFCRTVVPTGVIVVAKLTAAQVSAYFDTTGLGKAGQSYEGWALCNGNNSTPNLSDKFLRCATDAAGATGGADTHTLTTSEMPSHTHTIAGDQFKYGLVRNDGAPTFGAVDQANSGTDGAARVTASAGSGGAHNNMPAYYEAVPIMRL